LQRFSEQEVKRQKLLTFRFRYTIEFNAGGMLVKKKIALLTACLFLLSSSAFAAPLMDYERGKWSIDLNFRNTQNTVEVVEDDYSYSYPSKFNFEPTITVGVANKWAIQYRNVNAKSKNDSAFESGTTGGYYYEANEIDNIKLGVNEFNVLSV